jgi:hypothetical protein
MVVVESVQGGRAAQAEAGGKDLERQGWQTKEPQCEAAIDCHNVG